jgi:hypothetical protein
MKHCLSAIHRSLFSSVGDLFVLWREADVLVSTVLHITLLQRWTNLLILPTLLEF